MAGQKRREDILQNLRDFSNITLAGSESAIVAKRQLQYINNCKLNIFLGRLWNKQTKEKENKKE